MQASLTLPVDAIREGLAADPEWALVARYWNADIRFFVGTDNYSLRVEEGRVVRFERRPDASFAYTILIGGPTEAWREILKQVPPPYRRASRGLSPLSCSQRLFIFALQMRLNDRVALRIEGDCADRRPVACAA